MFEHEIIDRLVEELKSLFAEYSDIQVIPYNEFIEERDQSMIVVGIDNVTQVNVGLDDYQYDLTITVDTLIADDRSGTVFKSISKGISTFMTDYLIKRKSLQMLFKDIPAVGLLFNSSSYTITNDSNRVIFSYQVFTSSPMIL